MSYCNGLQDVFRKKCCMYMAFIDYLQGKKQNYLDIYYSLLTVNCVWPAA